MDEGTGLLACTLFWLLEPLLARHSNLYCARGGEVMAEKEGADDTRTWIVPIRLEYNASWEPLPWRAHLGYLSVWYYYGSTPELAIQRLIEAAQGAGGMDGVTLSTLHEDLGRYE